VTDRRLISLKGLKLPIELGTYVTTKVAP